MVCRASRPARRIRLTTSCRLTPPANCLVFGHSPRLEKRFSSLFSLYRIWATDWTAMPLHAKLLSRQGGCLYLKWVVRRPARNILRSDMGAQKDHGTDC